MLIYTLSHSTKHPSNWPVKLCSIAAGTLLLSGQVLSAAASDAWSGNFSIGFNNVAGNKDSNDLSVALKLAHNEKFQKHSPYRHTFEVNAEVEKTKTTEPNGQEITDKTRDNKSAIYTLGYFLDQQSYLEGDLQYAQDQILGMEEFKAVGAEYNRKVVDNPTHKFLVGVGLMYADLEYTDASKERDKGIGGKLSYDYTGKLTNTVSFTQNTLLQAMSGVKYAVVDSGLSYALTKNMSINLNHKVTYLSKPISGNSEKASNVTDVKLKVDF